MFIANFPKSSFSILKRLGWVLVFRQQHDYVQVFFVCSCKTIICVVLLALPPTQNTVAILPLSLDGLIGKIVVCIACYCIRCASPVLVNY